MLIKINIETIPANGMIRHSRDGGPYISPGCSECFFVGAENLQPLQYRNINCNINHAL